MLPCPFLYASRRLSAGFMTVVFAWSVWNGATYYVDIFGRRFEKELDQLRKEVADWQRSPKSSASTPGMPPVAPSGDVVPLQLNTNDLKSD